MTEKNETYSFRKRIVVFIDILGFASHVTQAASEDSADKAKQIDGAVLDIKRLGNSPNSETHIFSDSAIISVKDDPSEIQDLFRNLTYLTWSLMIKGVFIRGGVSYGKVSKDKNKPWGPAIIEAYKIESSVARYPRLALARSALEFLRSKHLEEKLESISRDHDGVYSIDVIPTCFTQAKSDAIVANEIGIATPTTADFCSIKNHLDKAYDSAVDVPRIFAKITWLCREWDLSAAKHHNEKGEDYRTKYFDDYTGKDVFDIGIGVLRSAPSS